MKYILTFCFFTFFYSCYCKSIPHKTNIDSLSNYVESDSIYMGYQHINSQKVDFPIDVIKTQNLLSRPVASILQMIQGQTAGMQVINNFEPGGETEIRLRGIGSIGNNNVLYVIDGLQTTMEPVFLNPEDIATLVVLKDVAAAAMYGYKGRNGVIIINTKRKTSNKLQIQFETAHGLQSFKPNIQMMDTQNYMDYIKAKNSQYLPYPIRKNPNGDLQLADYLWPIVFGELPQGTAYSSDTSDPLFNISKFPITKSNKIGTDWLDEIFQNAYFSSYNLSMAAAKNNWYYRLSAARYQQKGLLRYTSLEKNNLSSQLGYQSKKLNLGLQYTYSQTQKVDAHNGSEGNPIMDALKALPMLPVYDISGGPVGLGGTEGSNIYGFGNYKENFYGPNPVEVLWRNRNSVKPTQYHSIGSQLNYRLLSSVSLSANYNLLSNKSDQVFVNYPGIYSIGQSNSTTTIKSDNLASILNAYISFQPKIFQLNTSLIAGYELQKNKEKYFEETVFINGNRGRRNNLTAHQPSIFVLVDLDYKALSISSNNRLEKIFGNTAQASTNSVAAALHLNRLFKKYSENEKTFWKLKASYGKLKVDPKVADIFKDSFNSERHNAQNLGLEFGSNDQRFHLLLDWYKRNVSFSLFQAGFPNFGKNTLNTTSNKGVELNLSFKTKENRPFYSQIDFLLSKNSNRFSADPNKTLIGGSNRLGGIFTKNGQEISSYYGYKTSGILKDKESAYAAPKLDSYTREGAFALVDINKDNIINLEDRTQLGSPIPKMILALNGQLNYKIWELSVNSFAHLGHQTYNYTKFYTHFGFNSNLQRSITDQTWFKSGDVATLPNPTLPLPPGLVDYFIEDGSFYRIQALKVAVNFKPHLWHSTQKKQLQIYVVGNNLITFTKYTGMEPEIYSASLENDLSRNVDMATYPSGKGLSLGLKLNL